MLFLRRHCEPKHSILECSARQSHKHSLTHWIASSLALLAITYSLNTHAGGWKNIADGIEYQKVSAGTGFIHFFKIDTLKYKLDVITAKQFGLTNIDAKTIAQKSNALIAINGGFFTPEFASLGLLVQSGKKNNPIKMTSWWHIFQMNRFKPMIISKQSFELTPDIEMAIEAGPRILSDGHTLEGLKETLAERTAIGIDRSGKIIIAVTENYMVSLSKFAEYLTSVGCYDALNLDGGSSTQLYAKIKGFELLRAGLSPVANGVGVFPR